MAPPSTRAERSVTLALIGFGAIGASLWQRLKDSHAAIRWALLPRGSARHLPEGLTPLVDTEALIAANPQLVVECAGHGGLREHGPTILKAGIPLIIVSVGALADDGLRTALDEAAAAGNTRYTTIAGAIGGLDALAAARLAGLERVVYIGRKPPLAWRGTPAEQQCALDEIKEARTIFSGSAREAALTYPKNANVTAAVALAGLGFDATRVEMVADPEADGNMHEIVAEGAFGRLRFEISNRPMPDNPKTSWLAALSAEQAVRILVAQLE
ncbi:aspartate dehydrogenase [Rhodoligotrophos defluvii]|uniref:aspartate dehydrogenase n=1 Tax=Rhodoligotrophos defluvii TaxID=2561934 RepID=UPI0010C96DD5|nr:aspartate dehydrogenase [Rhodoligotrophos defluvii]